MLVVMRNIFFISSCNKLHVEINQNTLFNRSYLNNSRIIGTVVVRSSVLLSVCLSQMYCG